MRSPSSDVCVICGLAKACSRDHVPPRCIFPKPWPSDFVTVPACGSCNMQSSGLDERFKVFLGLTVGFHLDGDRSYREPVLRTLGRNHKLRSDIQKDMQRVVLRDSVSFDSQSAIAIQLDQVAHDAVVVRTVRGLYFHHTGNILGNRCQLTARWCRVLTDELFSDTNGWNTGTIGDPALVYKYAINPTDLGMTGWVLQFFQKTWSVVLSTPKPVDIDPEQQS